MTSIGERLKTTRLIAGDLSSRELGWLADVSETYPALIESGLRKVISAPIAARIAAVLGTSTDFLVSGTGTAPTKRQVLRAVAAARIARGDRPHGGISG